MATRLGNPVLKALDIAKTSTYHFKAVVISGAGFFTDSYDLFAISLVTKLLGRIYYYDCPEGIPTLTEQIPGTLPINISAAVSSVALCGTLSGQLFFGWAGDKWGRKKVYGITLLMMVVASIGQGLSLGMTRNSVMATLCFFRFWLGFGIGGDYPLSATIMSEYSNVQTRGAFVAAVFAMQGVGYLTASAVTIFLALYFRHRYPNSSNIACAPRQADLVWRLILMFGAIPAAFTYYSRSKMPETARYTALIKRNETQAALDMENVLHTKFTRDNLLMRSTTKAKREAKEYELFSWKFARRHGKQLFGTCVAWFLLDISYYSQTLFQTNVLSAVGWVADAKSMDALTETYINARASAILALISTIPGYWFTVFFIDKVGRKPIQLMGFFMMSAFMYVLALDFYTLRGHLHGDPGYSGSKTSGNHPAFVILYAFTFFFSNFGPNATTFIVPAELFPARLRSTCHGISSAAGKAGAIVGAFGFLYASQDKRLPITVGYKPGIGYKNSFILLAGCDVVGFFVTMFCVPETKGRSLEDLSGEDEDNKASADEENGKKVDDNVTED